MTIPNILIEFLMVTGDLILIALAMVSRMSRNSRGRTLCLTSRPIVTNRHPRPSEASERDLLYRWRSAFKHWSAFDLAILITAISQLSHYF